MARFYRLVCDLVYMKTKWNHNMRDNRHARVVWNFWGRSIWDNGIIKFLCESFWFCKNILCRTSVQNYQGSVWYTCTIHICIEKVFIFISIHCVTNAWHHVYNIFWFQVVLVCTTIRLLPLLIFFVPHLHIICCN